MTVPDRASVKVVHVTTVHSPLDIRIFRKECRSLRAAGYDVVLLAHGAPGEMVVDDVTIRLVHRLRSRLVRMLHGPLRMYVRLRHERARIVHLHDPELLVLGLLLRMSGMTVIYDAHEDTPRQILSKDYLPRWLRPLLAKSLESIEDFAARRFSAVVAATPAIAKRFERLGCHVETVNNFADIDEFGNVSVSRGGAVCYVGGISEIRGAKQMVCAAALARVPLILAGSFSDRRFRARLAALPEWSHVTELGHVEREALDGVFARSMAGLALFQPAPNHEESQPNKLFEYLSAGLPVIASNFPLWREIVEGTGCGLCVDPRDPAAIAEAITWIAAHPREAAEMGQRGRRAAEELYSWKTEARRLVALYDELSQA